MVYHIEIASRHIMGSEQSCTRGRSMLANLWRLEAASVEHRIFPEPSDLHAYLVTDFAAAFPSILHDYLFYILEAMSVPLPILSFLRALYGCSMATIVFNRRRFRTFPVRRGIRQGCPASMLLFALALDPVLRWMQLRILHTADRLQAYADDLGFALQNVFHTLPRLEIAFNELTPASGLQLNSRKCFLIPYSVTDERRLKAFLRRRGGLWGGCHVVLAARYLGFFIGPLANEQVWLLPLAKFRRAVLQIKPEHFGFYTLCSALQQPCASNIEFRCADVRSHEGCAPRIQPGDAADYQCPLPCCPCHAPLRSQVAWDER